MPFKKAIPTLVVMSHSQFFVNLPTMDGCIGGWHLILHPLNQEVWSASVFCFGKQCSNAKATPMVNMVMFCVMLGIKWFSIQ